MSNCGDDSMQLDFDQLLSRLAQHLHEADIAYMVIGGQAVIEHGRVRLTEDIDLTVAILPHELDRLLVAIKPLGLESAAPNPHDFAKTTHVLPVRQPGSPLRIDFSLTRAPYELQAIARGIDVDISGTAVLFVTAEDLVIHKVIAWRGRDIDDLRGIILKNPNLDKSYIRDWLKQFSESLELPTLQRFDELWSELG